MQNVEENQKLFDACALVAEYAGGVAGGGYNNKERGNTLIFTYPKTSLVPCNLYMVHSTGGMEYHKSWDWLMPVVNKLITEKPELRWLLAYVLDIEGLFWSVVEILREMKELKTQDQ